MRAEVLGRIASRAELVQNGNGNISQPSTTADTMNPANSIPPKRSCSAASSLAIKANTNETKNAKRASRRKWLCTGYLRPSAMS